MKKHLLKSLLAVVAIIFGSNTAWADEINATLVHTSSSGVPSSTAGAYVSTIDAEQEYINNSAFGNKNWQGAAYAEFEFVIPAGQVIQSASMVWNGIGSSKDRTTDVMYVNAGESLDYSDTGLGSGNAEVNLPATKIATVTFPKNTTKEFTTDVTNAVKAIAASQSYVIFKFTNNVGSGNLVGKGAASGAPTLVITTTSAASQTTYTVNYTDGTNVLKEAKTYDIAIGTEYTASAEDMASFAANDKKYIYVSGNTTATAVADAESNVINLVFREAATYNYTVKTNLGETISEGTGFEDDQITYYFPQYQISDSTLYETSKNSNMCRNTFTLDSNNKMIVVNYSEKEITGVVFLTEAESIEGSSISRTGNADIRCSMGAGAYFGKDVTVTTLPAGKYKLTAQVWGNSGTTFIIKAGETDVLSIDTKGYIYSETSNEFEISSPTSIVIPAVGNENRVIDLLYIQKTGDVEVKEPIYIETDLTSQFNALTNWQNWTGATGYTATNYCPAVTTNAGQTVQVCEKYEGTCDTTGEIFYQTVTGLTAGTYKIELYGGAAYTFGRGFSSEAFSTGTWNAGDHIDENTGVILYAETSEGKYEKEIPIYYATNFPDGAATVVLEGVVIGENGQVKIGMNKTSKSTNWHVIQLKGVTAQVDAVELHTATLAAAQAALEAEANAVITGSERTALEAAITANTTVSEETADAYKAAINALNAALTAFNNAKPAYQALADAKTYAATLTFKYAAAAKKEAAEAAAAAVATDAADATAKATALYQALRQYAESSALAEGVEGAVNMTDKIVNPAAEEALAEPWKTVKGESSGGSINILNGQPWTDGSNNATHKYFDGGDWGANAWDVALQQEITLPAGKYQLTAKMRASGDVEQTLFAGETAKAGQSIYDTGGLFDRGWNDTSIEFEMAEEGAITIGVRGVTTVQHNWMSFSDFRLVQLEAAALPVALANVKALKEFDSEEMDDVEATLTLTNAKVNFLTTDYVLLEDASAGLLLEGSGLGALVKEGDVLNGELAVTMKYNWGMWQAVLTNGIEGVTATAGEATPMVVTEENANAYTEDYDFRLAQFADVTINVNEGQLSFTTALLGEDPWSINDQFAVMPETITDGAIGTLTGYMASLYGMTFFTPTAFVEKAVDPQVAHATVTYALAEGDTFTSGQTVEVKNGEDVVATITYGEAGEGYADFTAAKQDSHIDGFAAFTEGNGTNGNKAGGTFYTIVPKYDGVITVGIVLNADKAFSVLEDGVAKENFNGLKATQRYYGTTAFNVTANKSYKFFCAGSKLGFYGFNYEYGEGTEAIDETDNGITTGITTVNTEVKAANGVYNLRGQKVENMVKGQLYIINGKKIMVK